MTTRTGSDKISLIIACAAMASVVCLSNILVQFPVHGFGLADWLTWGAFSYPFAFLVNDQSNRLLGLRQTRTVVLAGFLVGLLLSILLAPWRIAIASGIAFFCAHWLDALVFDRLRKQSWWQAPFLSSIFASLVDTGLFFSLAFAGSDPRWISWAFGDLAVKLLLACALLPVYRILSRIFQTPKWEM